MKILPFGAKKAKKDEESEDEAAPQAPELKKAKPRPDPDVTLHKSRFKFLLGLMMIIAAFTGVVVVFYFMVNDTRVQEDKISELSGQLMGLKDEKGIVEMELEQLKNKEGEIELETILMKAKNYHDPKEFSRQEGLLWIDQKNDSYLITLGALNGLQPGSRLQVYDGEEKIGTVSVMTPLDVISYVTVENNFKADMDKGPFKVAVE